MKSHKNIFERLKGETPNINPQFKRDLGQKLFVLAKNRVDAPDKRAFMHLIFDLYRQMKRNFFLLPATGSLLLAVMGVIFFRPLGPEKNLAYANEILNQASSAYQGSGIFHEKTLVRSAQGGETYESILEYWSDDLGRALSLEKDPTSEEITGLSLISFDEYGDGANFVSPGQFNGNPEDWWQDAETTSDWLEVFEGEKTYCLKADLQGDYLSQAFLTLAKDNPSYYQVTGFAGPITTEINTLSMIEAIQEEIEAYDYKEVTENGVKYIVFSITQPGDGSEESYYFDSNTYEYKKFLSISGPNHFYEVTYLESGFDPDLNATEIFNPENYQNLSFDLIELPLLATEPPFNSRNITEDGCYDYQGNLLEESATNALLESLPEETLEEWNSLFQDMLDSEEDANVITITNPEPVEEQETEEAQEQKQSWIHPANTGITQAFHEGHTAWDYRDMEDIKDEKTPIYSITEGTVLSVIKDTWNAGYGNTVLIDHGDGIESFYAHLGEILVKEGQTVSEGEQIAIMGNTGRVYGRTGIHLHFEIYDNGEKVNPLLYLEKRDEL